MIGAKSCTYGHLMTLLSQIEAILNSRPLYALSDNPNDMQALTPGHFIIGEPFIVPPPIDVPSQTNNSVKRIREEQRNIIEGFWKRWENEYLTSLFQRKKWTKEKKPLKIGQLVLIADENLSPGRWLMGRIIELIPSKDKLIRAVVVKTPKSKFTRPVQKIKVLPVVTIQQRASYKRAKNINKKKRKKGVFETNFNLNTY